MCPRLTTSTVARTYALENSPSRRFHSDFSAMSRMGGLRATMGRICDTSTRSPPPFPLNAYKTPRLRIDWKGKITEQRTKAAVVVQRGLRRIRNDRAAIKFAKELVRQAPLERICHLNSASRCFLFLKVAHAVGKLSCSYNGGVQQRGFSCRLLHPIVDDPFRTAYRTE